MEEEEREVEEEETREEEEEMEEMSEGEGEKEVLVEEVEDWVEREEEGRVFCCFLGGR